MAGLYHGRALARPETGAAACYLRPVVSPAKEPGLGLGRRVVLAAAAVIVAAAAPTEAQAEGRRTRPLSTERFERLEDHAPARGVQILREPSPGRVRISAGSFLMGSSPAEMVRAIAMCRREVLRARCDSEASGYFRAEGLLHEVTLDAYDIDRTEVTNEAYARCVDDGACAPPAYVPSDSRWNGANLPVTEVRWEDARAYCAWAGGRLPTEAEWEYAARGRERREFPWGNVYNPHLCNHGAAAPDETDATDGFLLLAPVGSFPDGATPQGVLDLAGNAAEWVSDLYEPDDNGFGYAAGPVTNPKGPSTGFHIVRGGSYATGAPWTRGAARLPPPLLRASWIGCRCAADVR
jgi:formylglycine-generating enzyme required for sulfatase activity